MNKFYILARPIAFVIAATVLFTGCASTTLIDSVPSGANLYLDGEYVGVTPHTMTDTKLVGTCTSVRMEKKNYYRFQTNICRAEEVDGGAVVAGVFLYFPFLWTMKYKPTHIYELNPMPGNEAAVEKLVPDEDSLDQLWKSESKEKSHKMSIEPGPESEDGIMKLNEGKKISEEEFDQQKTDKPE